MEQLYYTSCLSRRSLDGGDGGFKVRAASPGLAAVPLSRLGPMLSYQLPDPDLSMETAPIRLALLPGDDGGRWVCHSRYVGNDPETKRSGNYFTHLLSAPEGLSAREAIRFWRSEDWQCSDGDFDAHLPRRERVPAPGALAGFSPEGIKAFLSLEDNRQDLEWLLSAILLPDRFSQIVLVDSPERVARMVMLASDLLPPAIAATLTFSTFEARPLMVHAHIVGTVLPDHRDTPSSWFREPTATLDSRTRKRTAIDVPPPFARWLIERLEKESFETVAAEGEAVAGAPGLDIAAVNRIGALLLGEIEDEEPWLSALASLPPSSRHRILERDHDWPRVHRIALETESWPAPLRSLVSEAPRSAREHLGREGIALLDRAMRDDAGDTANRMLHGLLPAVGVSSTTVLETLGPHLPTAGPETRGTVLAWLRSFGSEIDEVFSDWLLASPVTQLPALFRNRNLSLSVGELASLLGVHSAEHPELVGDLLAEGGRELLIAWIGEVSLASCPTDDEPLEILSRVLGEFARRIPSKEPLFQLTPDPAARRLQLRALLRLDPSLSLDLADRLVGELPLGDMQLTRELAESFLENAPDQAILRHRNWLEAAVEETASAGKPISDRLRRRGELAWRLLGLRFGETGLRQVRDYIESRDCRLSPREIQSVVISAIAEQLPVQPPSESLLLDFLTGVERALPAADLPEAEEPAREKRFLLFLRAPEPIRESLPPFWKELLEAVVENPSLAKNPETAIALAGASIHRLTSPDTANEAESPSLIRFLTRLRRSSNRKDLRQALRKFRKSAEPWVFRHLNSCWRAVDRPSLRRWIAPRT